MRMIALLLCLSLLSSCATTLKHPNTGTQIECRTTIGFQASDVLIVPLLPILVPAYFITGGPFWGGPIKDFYISTKPLAFASSGRQQKTLPLWVVA